MVGYGYPICPQCLDIYAALLCSPGVPSLAHPTLKGIINMGVQVPAMHKLPLDLLMPQVVLQPPPGFSWGPGGRLRHVHVVRTGPQLGGHGGASCASPLGPCAAVHVWTFLHSTFTICLVKLGKIILAKEGNQLYVHPA